MNDTMNLRDTIAPKSDQLNADDLIAGTITVLIMGVRRGSRDQPVIVDIDGGRMPYKPCLSMRRVMISAWSENGSSWVGKSMTLYNDPSITFGKVAMGGIRISHMSHIKDPLNMMLTTAKARRSKYKVDPLIIKKEIKEITPDNKALWGAAKDRYRKNGNLDAVKEVSTISELFEKQLIEEVKLESESSE